MNKIKLKGITHHNLKNIDIEIPHNQFTVISGVSGSGKSTLAEEVIYKDAERRYLETYSVHARQLLNKLRRPEAEHISGLRPAILLQQKNFIVSPRSTVGTLTEIHDLLRLFYARLGKTVGKEIEINRSLFSFNRKEGACPVCNGLGVTDKIDPDLLISDPAKTLREGVLVITTPSGYIIYSQVTMDVMSQVCESEGFSVDTPWQDLTDYQKDVVFYGSSKIRIPFGKHTLESRMKWKGITAKPRDEGYYKGIIPIMDEILKRDRNPNILRFARTMECEACRGSRYNEKALNVTIEGKNIADLSTMSFKKLKVFFCALKFTSDIKETGKYISKEILNKIEILEDLGLDYLSLNRNAQSLSGGEAARIRLGNQINSELHGILYVFDEPAAGLHAFDLDKLLIKLKMLSRIGNTVIAVDHNEQIIREADYIVELGPGAGIYGGELIYQGTQPDWKALAKINPQNETAAYLSGIKQFKLVKHGGNGKNIHLVGAKSRNLKNLDILFPLNKLVVLTGVSGSGKSSLLKFTLANYLKKKLHGANIEFGKFEKIEGIEQIDKIIEMDQAPIGKTPRSNPATYTKLFDEIRDFYALLDVSKKNGLNKSSFSFNTKGGRCENCQGAGYLQTGMHFLGNVDIICPVCNGKRFERQVLKVRYKDKNINDVLEMTIVEAHTFFKDLPKITRYLKVLEDLGLAYLKLGQRSATLSGGEAQRIKLAAELSRPSTGKTLYIIDEPSRGLHLNDIHILLKSFYRLIENGNSVFLIEHNLRMIMAADHIIDLGPGSGENGGELVFSGTVEMLKKSVNSKTAKALTELLRESTNRKEKVQKVALSKIELKGVRTNNLKNIDLSLPVNKITVIAGVSGSGKSSLLFDTIYAESQKRFNENFSPYVRTMLGQQKQGDFDYVRGISPAIAIRQRSLKVNERSTVGTLTEIYDYYRLLYSRIGQLRFPENTDNLTASHFSFNQVQGACKQCSGLGFHYIPDMELFVTNPEKSILKGALDGTKTGKFYGQPDGQYVAILQAVGLANGIDFLVPWNSLSEKSKKIAFEGCGKQTFDVKWQYKRKSREGVHHFQSVWIGFSGHVMEEYHRKQLDKRGDELLFLMKKEHCPYCNGKRLKPETLAIKINGLDISDLTKLSVEQSLVFFNHCKPVLNPAELKIYEPVSVEINRRLKLISQSGLAYLSLDRTSASLSGGEVQRLRLASMLGSELTGITYILDEPTAGLHPTDTIALIKLIKQIRDLGNTILIAEHDEMFIKSADYIVELGPLAGNSGGEIIARGTYSQILDCKESITAKYLRNDNLPFYRKQKPLETLALKIKNASANNLKNIDIEFYASGINILTGPSGSGKSSLLFDVLYNSILHKRPVNCDFIELYAIFEQVIAVNQDTPTVSGLSSPVTFCGIFDYIRDEFAKEAKKMDSQIGKSYFSPNSPGGRCETCKGQGFLKTSLDFLPDNYSVCPDCNGKRFTREAQDFKLYEKSIADVLEMSVNEALAFFKNFPNIEHALYALSETNLGYLKLGQSLNSLSGGEIQRLKLAKKIIKPSQAKSLILLDEPTTGLHFEDVKHLLLLLDKMVKDGHTIIMTEHNPVVILNADYVIDMGPGGGDKGGKIMAQGTPFKIMEVKESLTGNYLKKCFSMHNLDF